jgi:hypothetical protein
MRRVVDASPAIFLAKIGELGLLQLGAEEVFFKVRIEAGEMEVP